MQHQYVQAGQRLITWVKSSLSIVWLVIAAGYFAVVTVEAVYRNYQTRQRLTAAREQLVVLKQKEEHLQALSVYYQSNSFKELELRRNLLLKREGETVYSLPESSRDARLARQKQETVKEGEGKQVAVWRQWVTYITGI